MKIIVFRATGETGIQLVEQAIEADYKVVAYARNYLNSILTVSKSAFNLIF